MPDSPAWRIFSVNECEWYVARSIDEAKAAAAADWGYSVEDAEAEELFDEADEVSDAAMDKLIFCDTDENEAVTARRTFREQLARLVAEGLDTAAMFAATDY